MQNLPLSQGWQAPAEGHIQPVATNKVLLELGMHGAKGATGDGRAAVTETQGLGA